MIRDSTFCKMFLTVKRNDQTCSCAFTVRGTVCAVHESERKLLTATETMILTRATIDVFSHLGDEACATLLINAVFQVLVFFSK
jgi:hypothetical protein